ncbi:MAG: sugar isomerase [Desulfobacteraceae bacterium]|nr:MAG: sugar isomerase [Desulfobacteraceae bacterium]
MNLTESKYKEYALVREMLQTPEIIRRFRTGDLTKPLAALRKTSKLFLVGEGSSRIFPAKNAIQIARTSNSDLTVYTEGCRQAQELALEPFTVFGASNSGKTKEVIALLTQKRAAFQFALTSFQNTPLERLCSEVFILSCGKEEAVAATKSVIEQGLFYHQLLLGFFGKAISQSVLDELSDKALEVLNLTIDDAMVAKISQAPAIYFAGRNNGVAEEATLKTNEITRKKSAFLEGTYAVHGIEEVMSPQEVVVVIEPYAEEEAKFQEVLEQGVGMSVFAISSRRTLFPGIQIPALQGYDSYLQLLACWNLLVEIGIRLGINMDKPVRARKVGNEYQ